MGKKTSKKKLPKSLRKGSLPRPIADVWAAGIGALAQARKKGGDSFESLIEIGTTVAGTGSKAAKSAVEQVETAAGSVVGLAGGTADGVQRHVEDVVEGVLGKLGVPGRNEVLSLQAQIESLQIKISALTSTASSGAERGQVGAGEDQADRTVYHVTKHNRGWSVQRAGAERATSVHATKKEALVDARRTARSHAPSHLVVYKADGTVGEETDYDA